MMFFFSPSGAVDPILKRPPNFIPNHPVSGVFTGVGVVHCNLPLFNVSLLVFSVWEKHVQHRLVIAILVDDEEYSRMAASRAGAPVRISRHWKKSKHRGENAIARRPVVKEWMVWPPLPTEFRTRCIRRL
jgi:hypothetical protein